jgi:hypothetical protein
MNSSVMSVIRPEADQHSVTSRRLLIAAYLVAALIVLAPILIVEIPPLVDYPNHLARIHVLADYASSPLLQQNYAIEWRPIPNLAIDGIASALSWFVPPMLAGRVVLALTVLLTAGGILILHKVVHGRIGPWPLAAFGVAYSLPFAWGLINFQLSIGLFLFAFAGWIASRNWRPTIRLPLFAVASTAVYFAHLFGYAALLIAIGLYELRGALRDSEPVVQALLRRMVLAGGAFGLPLLLFLASLLDRTDGVKPLALGIWYGDAFSKLTALLAPFLFYGSAGDIGLILVMLLFVLAARRASRCAVAPALVWLLAGLLILTAAAPAVLNGLFLDGRIGFVLGCVTIAALNPIISQPVLRRTLTLTLLGVLAVRTAATYEAWQERYGEYAEFRRALQLVTPGARILTVHDNGKTMIDTGRSVRWYMAVPALPNSSQSLAWRNIDTLSVIDRQAYTPTLFKYPSSQPLRSAARHRDIDPVVPAARVTIPMLTAGADADEAAALRRRAADKGEIAFWAGWPQRFDYVVVIRTPGIDRARLDGLPLQPLASGSFFEIYRVGPAQ